MPDRSLTGIDTVKSGDVTSEAYERAVWQCGQVEAELVRLGGIELLEEARAEAERLLAQDLPWDGHGIESAGRVVARLEVLMAHLDRARGAPGEPV